MLELYLIVANRGFAAILRHYLKGLGDKCREHARNVWKNIALIVVNGQIGTVSLTFAINPSIIFP